MPIQLNCASCNKKLSIPDEMLGKNVTCPACKAKFHASTSNAGPGVSVVEEGKTSIRNIVIANLLTIAIVIAVIVGILGILYGIREYNLAQIRKEFVAQAISDRWSTSPYRVAIAALQPLVDDGFKSAEILQLQNRNKASSLTHSSEWQFPVPKNQLEEIEAFEQKCVVEAGKMARQLNQQLKAKFTDSTDRVISGESEIEKLNFDIIQLVKSKLP